MKKIISFAIALILTMSVFCVFVSASPVSNVLEYAHSLDKNNFYPKETYRIAESILRQIPFTYEQAEQVKILMKEAREAVPVDRGFSLESFEADEQKILMDKFDKICEIAKINYEVRLVDGSFHEGDYAFTFYYDGRKIGDVNLDSVKTTGGNESNENLILTAICVSSAAVAVAVALYALKKKDYEA